MGNEEGKPMYINGPFDDAAKQQAILAQLASVSGGEEPAFVIGMRSSELRELDNIGREENDLSELDGEVVIDVPFARIESSINQG